MPTMEEYAKQPIEQRLQRMERTADELHAAIKGQSAAALTKRPDAKNWAGVEVVCHLRDAEELFEGRFQMFLAMGEVKLLPIDTDRVAVDRQYLRCDAGESIEAFRRWRAQDLAIFQYTSGTTRELPDAVKHSHRAIVTLMVAALYGTGLRPGDRFICPSSPAWGHTHSTMRKAPRT